MLRKILCGMVASALVLALLVPATAMAQTGAAQPVDPPPQVAQLRQQFEGLTTQQIEAQGYVPEGPCVTNPQGGVGAMGIHAINRQLYQAQFPNGIMDPANPNVLLVGRGGKVIGLEWEAKDVGQGPIEMFGRTIELQSGHPGVEEPHYMLHIYFKPNGEVLFGTNDQTAFAPEGSCPEVSATATSGATHAASSGATATPTTATATPTPTALAQTGGPSPMPVLAAGAAVGLLVE